MIAYSNGTFCDKTQIKLSPEDRGFLFADGVYEVIRAYRGKLFGLDHHIERLARGLHELRIGGFDVRKLEDIGNGLLRENGWADADATVYFQITRGCAPRSHLFPPAGTPPTVYAEAKPCVSPIVAQREGASCITVPDQRWARCDIKTVGLLANTLAYQRAHDAGAIEAIFVRDGALLEGSHSSILFVKDGVLVAPPLTNYLLPSVTRIEVLKLAQKENISVDIRTCNESELREFTEVLMVGTTVEIVPIITVDGVKVGRGLPGPVTRKLQKAFGIPV